MKEDKQLKQAEYPIMSAGPNRRTRRRKLAPHSSKIAKCSMNNPEIYRTNKFNGNF